MTSAAPRERLLALDAFRGLTVAGMLLVNNPGSWSAIYAPLEHAPWHGWTPTDLIFPFFLFIVGITTELSKKEPKQILRRGLLIILFGLLLNAFPFFWWGKIAGVDDPTFLQRVVYRFEHLRFAGVLQRIGLVYLFAGFIALKATKRQIVFIIAAILAGYWALLHFGGPLEPPEKTFAAQVDRAVLGENHIWVSSKTWDPEGPLSTLPAIATALLGVLAAGLIAEKSRPLPERVANLFGIGALGMLAGWFWGGLFPINKNLWTSSYVLFTAGFASIALATCLWLIDVHGKRAWAKPFVIYGMNPMVAFVGSGIMARLIGSLLKVDYEGKRISLQAASYKLLFERYFTPELGSLLWALCFVGFWLAILWLLYRRNIFLKV
jgi:predicted acyltransferase